MALTLATPRYNTEVQAFQNFRRQAREHPVEWLEERAGFRPWRKSPTGKYDQLDMLNDVLSPQDVFWAHCHGTGKSSTAVLGCIAAYVGSWPEIVIPVMGAGASLSADVFWSEFHKWGGIINARTHGKFYEWFGMPNLTEWHHPEFPYSKIMSHNPASTGSGQGRKAARMIIPIDEAVDVRKEVWQAVRGLKSAGTVKLLIMTNPLERNCIAYTRYWNAAGIKCVSMDAEDHPNVYRELPFDHPDFIKGMIGLKYIKELQEQCARERSDGDHTKHPEYLARIKGIWPDSNTLGVVCPWGLFDAATARGLQLKDMITAAPKRAGVDVSHRGMDNSVVVIWQGEKLKRIEIRAGEIHQRESVKFVEDILKEEGFTHDWPVVVDYGGAPGVCDELKNRGWNAIGMNFGGKPDNDRYSMAVDECAYTLQEGYLEGRIYHDASIPAPVLMRLGSELQRETTKTQGGEGKLTLESKKAWKKEHNGQSPDVFDAAVIGYKRREGLATATWV